MKLSSLLLEDFGNFLFSDPDKWKDPADLAGYANKFDQDQEPNTDEETKIQQALIKWKTARTGEWSKDKNLHNALVKISKDPKFKKITQPNPSLKVLYRGSSLPGNAFFRDSEFTSFMKSTTYSDWKYTNVKSYRMVVCSKIFNYNPTSLITSWSSDSQVPFEFADDRDPVIYVQDIKSIKPGDFIFTGGGKYDNSFDMIAQDNSGEEEVLGLKDIFQVRIMILQERLSIWLGKPTA